MDVQIKIGAETRAFNLLSEEGKKLWNVGENPLVPIKSSEDDPTYENLPSERILSFGQTDWIGGMGQLFWNAKDKYATAQNITSHDRGLLYLGPKLNSVSLAAAPIWFFLFKNVPFTATTTKVYKLVTGAWTEVLDVSGLPDTIECVGEYNGSIFVGLTTNNYRYSSTGNAGDWVAATDANSVAHSFLIAAPLSGTTPLFVKATRPNVVRTSIHPENDGTGWTDPPYLIGDDGVDITNLISFNGKTLICKADGLYELPPEEIPIALMPEFRHKRSSNNFKYWTQWQSALYFTLAKDIGELTTRFYFDLCGPLGLASGLQLAGYCTGLAADDKFVYACMNEGGYYTIYRGRERRTDVGELRWEWESWIYLGSNACNAMAIIQVTGETPKLWIGYGTGSAYVILSDNPLEDSNFKFATVGHVITSWFDASFITWNKLFYKIWASMKNITPAIKIKVYYQTDTMAIWDILWEFVETGVQYRNLVTPVQCKSIRLKFELMGDGNNTPILEEWMLRGVLQPESSRLLDFVVELEDTPTRKPAVDIAFLRSGRGSATPIEIKDLRFGTITYVTFLPATPSEVELRHEPKSQPVLGARIQAQEIDWTP